ncbi:MAG: hypothetical protein ACD_63C00231G0003 [uncultured bacterium]|nr:MAG: hypothetical protein ACD_63C00231G0003 [uncultured bacterium]
MMKKNSKIKKKRDKRACGPPLCLNLKKIEKERRLGIRYLINLRRLVEAERKEGEGKSRRGIYGMARNLLDLRPDQIKISKKAKLVGKVEKTQESAEVEIESAKISVEASREDFYEEKREVVKKSVEFPDASFHFSKKDFKEENEKPSEKIFAAEEDIFEPVAGEFEGTFTEYFYPGEEKFEGTEPFIKSSNEIFSNETTMFIDSNIDLLHPAMEISHGDFKRSGGKLIELLQLQKKIGDSVRLSTKSWKKSFVVFVAVSIFLASSVGALATYQRSLDSQSNVINKTSLGASNLRSASVSMKQQKFGEAVTDFERASQYFVDAKKDIDEIGFMSSKLVSLVPKGKAGLSIIRAGVAMSEAGKGFTRGMGYFKEVEGVFGSSHENKLSLSDALVKSQSEFAIVSENLKVAQREMNEVKISRIPASFRDEFLEAKEMVALLDGATQYFIVSSRQLASILGGDGPKRYLVLFANSDEIRGAVGGFPGSYMIVDFDGGNIKNMKFEDIYTARGLQRKKVAPPKPFQLITDNFEMQDAAWFIDYETSAKKIAEYYELSEIGTTVDGVITISSDIIPNLLDITGSIEVPEYGKVITKENYLEVIENEVESVEARASGEPKKILELFMTSLLGKILSPRDLDWMKLLGVFNEAVKEKNILMYFSDKELEEFAEKNNAAGDIKDFSKDYLSVMRYNIGGGKTEKDIVREDISHVASLGESGSLEGSIEIKRRFEPQDEISKIKNVTWFKVVLPKDAEFMGASGFDVPYPLKNKPTEEAVKDDLVSEIEENTEYYYDGAVAVSRENDKVVVGFWLGIEPDGEKAVQLSYKLNSVVDVKGFLNNADDYTFVFQNQPGKDNVHFESRLNLPPNVKTVWQDSHDAFINIYPDKVSTVVDNPKGDVFYSVVLEKK